MNRQVIAETRYFMSRAEKMLAADERMALVDYIAADPLRGNIIIGGGGIRKCRFAKGSKGKSGGVRVIYYYYDGSHPIYLLEIFGKNEKADLGKAQLNTLVKFTLAIKAQFKD